MLLGCFQCLKFIEIFIMVYKNKEQEVGVIVFGFVGSVLDAGPKGANRWTKWRPTLSLCQHEDKIVERLELLVLDQNAHLVQTLVSDIQQVSPETQVNLHEINIHDLWDFEEVYNALFQFCRGYSFDTAHEDYYVHITTGTHVAQICLFLLAEARYFPAQLVQSSPPRKGTHEAGQWTQIDLDLSKYDRIAQRFNEQQEEANAFLKSGIVTENKQFNTVIHQLERVAFLTKAPVMLQGPAGAGKSHLARRLYELKKQRHQLTGHFIQVNCAALKGHDAAASLFGHVKGAFAGAAQARAGLLKAADKGVLFLDEIAALGADEQAMLIGALEQQRFRPIGADHEIESQFQLIVGTHKDLQEEVRQGRFREDLLVRIQIWSYRLPSLKERREDIAPNIDYELQQVSKQLGTQVTFNKEARQAYVQFAMSANALWTANFRDLSASIQRMATLAEAGRIRLDDVKREIILLEQRWAPSENNFTLVQQHLEQDQLNEIDLFDMVQLEKVLEICQSYDSVSDAGRALFAQSRLRKKSKNDADRLVKYLSKFGLDWEMLTSKLS